jgi:uncharacterized protein (DUF2062 family)
MPREIASKATAWLRQRRDRWYLRLFGDRITQRHLWSLNRRSVAVGAAAGVAIAFIPLPLHTLLAVVVALMWRLNLPVTVASTLVVNPLTIVPVYYAAYRVGALLLQEPVHRFRFKLDWQWLESGLGPRWKAFLLGCAVFAVIGALLSRFLVSLLWRSAVVKKYQLRRERRASCETDRNA